MGKPVKVIWKADGQICAEYCVLVSDDDHVGCSSDGTPIMIGEEDPRPMLVSDLDEAKTMVMFEDEGGVFGLDPRIIIEIKDV